MRPIDNFSACGVNSATGMPERLRVEAVDEVAALIRGWAEQLEPGTKLVGKTYDLRKAYRQLTVQDSHRHAAWVCAWNPEAKRPQVCQLNSLPFGATSAVSSFLRSAEAIKYLGTTQLSLAWTSFFDDFVVLCMEDDVVSTDQTVRLLFKVLGWEISSDPEEDLPFSQTFGALGVTFDARDLGSGCFYVGNTQSRKDELRDIIDVVLEQNFLAQKTAQSLRSRLLFAEAQIYGRTAKLALSQIGEAGLSLEPVTKLSPSLRFSLEWMRDRVLMAPPRQISTRKGEQQYLFLDGACEERGSQTLIGGVLFDEFGAGVACFGEILPTHITSVWQTRGVKQLIASRGYALRGCFKYLARCHGKKTRSHLH